MLEWFWSEWFWLPPRITWNDIKPEEGLLKTSYRDLFVWPFITMAALLIFRNYFLLPFIFTPIGKYYGVRSKPYIHPPFNLKLDQLYTVNRARPPPELLDRYAAEVGWSKRQVERWLRQKALSLQMTTLDKFNDSGWQAFHYTCIFILGIFAVYSQPFFWDLDKAFENYPHSSISEPLWWYFMITIGFYMSQTWLLFTLTRKHDFAAMLSHHIITLAMLLYSWSTNFVKPGSVPLSLHEFIDAFLAAGKLFKYCGRNDLSDIMGVTFALGWVGTRVLLYPLHGLRVTFEVAPRIVGVWPLHILMAGLQILIVFLNIYWTIIIFSEIVIKLKNWQNNNVSMSDPRSSPDEMSDEDKEHNEPKKNI